MVTTGFSRIHVALYANEDHTVTYSGVVELARAKKMESEIEFKEGSEFSANNTVVERTPRKFQKGKLNLTVDGLTGAEYKLLFGISPEMDSGASAQVLNFGDINPPYMGVGAVKKMQQDGVESFRPIIFRKCQFAVPKESAETEEVDGDTWQVQELSADIFRDDSTKHIWQTIPEENFSTEAEAVAFIKKVLGDRA